MKSQRSFHVVVLAGDERQTKGARSVQALVDSGSTEPVRLQFVTPDWTPNWGRVLRAFVRSLAHADGAIIGTYVPTELGRAARREVRLRRIPHVRTSKLGQHGIAAAVLEVVELAKVA